jgi:hypothetical protein
MDITTILSVKYADAEWKLLGEDYAGLTWLSEGEPPTEAELTALWPSVEYEVAHEAVENARQSAYQATADPIFFEYQRGDKTEAEWLDAVQAVKTAHPYPTPPKK